MKTRAESGTTKTGEPYVVLKLEDGDAVIMKAYASADGERIRIILPELVNYTQTVINPDSKMIEFDRNPRRLKR